MLFIALALAQDTLETPEPPAPTPVVEGGRVAPEGWVSLVGTPHIEVRADYAGSHNFTKARLPGYGVADAWLRQEPAQALAEAALNLSQWGYTLVVHDAYRPVRATLAMCAWAARTDQVWLLDQGYIARKSGHNHGHTVDVSLSKEGQDLDFGSPFDHFGTESHTSNASDQAAANRQMLKKALEEQGFRNYPKEWWHFRYPMKGTSPLDVPYGAEEPDSFTEPEGWDQPGWSPTGHGAH